MLTFPNCPACGEGHWQRLLYSRYGQEQNLWASGNPDDPGFLNTDRPLFIEAMDEGGWACGGCQKAPDAQTLAAIQEIFNQADKILPF